MSLNEYKLSCELAGHSLDVRAVTEGPDGTIISGSRDKTAKIWKPEGNGFTEILTMKDHSNFVGAVCVVNDKNWICTGSNDSTICIYQFNTVKPFMTLKGHTGTVCSIANANKEGQILSGSWDKTAKLWTINDTGFTCVTFEGHEAAVWAVCTLKSGKYATGSADKFIRLWDSKGQKLVVLKGHTDCVRGLAPLADGGLLSCSNDGTIRRWNDSWECVNEFHGHSNYIYTISIMDEDTFVTGGEDSTIRMWSVSQGKSLGDEIQLPAQSVWTVTCMKNSDIVVGTSDGMIRVFTKTPDRVASEQILASFTLAVQTRIAESSKELGGVKVNDLPGPEALLQDGTQEAQTKLIRQPNGKILCYQWLAGKWECLGDVTGASGGSQKTSGKTLFEGKEYDYVFTVDIQEGAPPIKLPYNLGEDPWVVAQKFIHKHELPQVYLDQVANFIVQNSESVPVIGSGGYADPFTGEGRYVPGAGNDFQVTAANADPFTGGSSYTTTTNGSSAPVIPMDTGANFDPFTGTSSYTSSNGRKYRGIKHYPNKDYHTLATYDAAKILLKLQEFNIKSGGEQQFSKELLENVVAIAGTTNADDITDETERTLKKMYSWPQDCLFPVLDVIRLAIRTEQVCSKIVNFELLTIIIENLEAGSPAANRIMAIRCLSNMITHRWGRCMIDAKFEGIMNGVRGVKSGNVAVQNALSVLFLNLSIAQLDVAVSENCKKIAECVVDALMWVTEVDAIFRMYQAIGNMTETAYKKVVLEVVTSMEIVVEKMKGHAEGRDTDNYERLREIASDLYEMVKQ
ncbi:phospholipase A-2-activating protein [Culicoides brevitarsis]|uniref:phospholipase A-2-activating protein n=1 Tax=Culicoides brevitarsis TaxID=469753 RepID=UPI00307B2F59